MEKDIKGLKLMHSFMCIGVLLMILMLHYFISPIELSDFDQKVSSMTMTPLCVAAISLLLSNFLFKKRVQAIGTNEITSDNFNEYKAAYILRWALLEGATLISVIFYFFVEKHPAIIIVALLMLLLLFVSKPKLD